MNIRVNEKIFLVDIDSIKLNPNNRNKHPEDQIARLAEIITAHGFRSPLIISNRSGLLVSGHGRWQASKLIGLKKLPVMYQDFDSDEQEYAAGIAENAIASWAHLDLSNIHLDLQSLGPFNLEELGINNFQLEPNPGTGSQELSQEDFNMFKHVCPKCGFEFDEDPK